MISHIFLSFVVLLAWFVICVHSFDPVLQIKFHCDILRHENEIIAYGSYELILPDGPQLFAYTREW